MFSNYRFQHIAHMEREWVGSTCCHQMRVGSGQRFTGSGRVRKRDPRTTLQCSICQGLGAYLPPGASQPPSHFFNDPSLVQSKSIAETLVVLPQIEYCNSDSQFTNFVYLYRVANLSTRKWPHRHTANRRHVRPTPCHKTRHPKFRSCRSSRRKRHLRPRSTTTRPLKRSNVHPAVFRSVAQNTLRYSTDQGDYSRVKVKQTYNRVLVYFSMFSGSSGGDEILTS